MGDVGGGPWKKMTLGKGEEARILAADPFPVKSSDESLELANTLTAALWEAEGMPKFPSPKTMRW